MVEKKTLTNADKVIRGLKLSDHLLKAAHVQPKPQVAVKGKEQVKGSGKRK